MKISYTLRWCRDTGTAYRQTIRITEAENRQLFGGRFRPGVNYGNADTGSFVAADIYGVPGYKKQLARIVPANTIVFVGDDPIPIY